MLILAVPALMKMLVHLVALQIILNVLGSDYSGTCNSSGPGAGSSC